MRRLSLPLLAILSSGFLPLNSLADDVWFPWPLVPQVAGAATDASALNGGAAGAHGFVAAKDGHFVLGDGTRIRFWGANLTSDEAFPDARTAHETATYLAQGGVNIARLHHMDNVWGIKSKTSIWKETADGHLEVDPAQLDKVHRLIAALKAKGIYSNINLKVSKKLSASDGFPASVSDFPEFQKRVDIFDRRMIEHQKAYARVLLTTVNPYTGLKPVDDPAVAVVEINNENSLLGYWTKNYGQGFEKFPIEFREELANLWNQWLAKAYDSDQKLATAWSSQASTDSKPLIDSSYAWKNTKAGTAVSHFTHSAETSELTLRVEKTDGIDWHAQISAPGLTLKDGDVYTIAFDYKADAANDVPVMLGVDTDTCPDESWRELGFRDTISPTSEWKHYERSFLALSVGNAIGRLDFNAGQHAGTFSLRHVSLTPGSVAGGLGRDESLAKRTVKLPQNPTRQQWADWITFLADTERAFADEMRGFLRDELHVHVPITCSQIDYGGMTGVSREQGSDFADGHAYWQHPDFGATVNWNADLWTIKNSPQLAALTPKNFQELGALAIYRIEGKPYTISEYDHPAPSEFSSEMYPSLAAFASIQDWDGLYPFCSGPFGPNDKDGRIANYFDQQHNPSKWGQATFATRVFRSQLIPAASASATLHVASPLWAESHNASSLWSKHVTGEGYGFLNTRLSISDRGLAAGTPSNVVRAGTPESTAPVSVVKGPSGALLKVNAPKASAIVGFVGGAETANDFLAVVSPTFGKNFASLTAVSLDEAGLVKSKRILVTLVGRSENQEMVWNENRTSVGSHWGHGPTVVEFIPATVSLATSGPRNVYGLAPDGSRDFEVPARWLAGRLTFATDPSHPTLHYEVTE